MASNEKIYSIISAYMGRIDNIFKFYLDKECFTFDDKKLKEIEEERDGKIEQTKREMISAVRDAIKAERPEDEKKEAFRLSLAERIFNLVPPWDHEEDETIETTAETIKNDPEAIINYLLDMIDMLNE